MLFSVKAAATAATVLSFLGLSSARADTHLCEQPGPFDTTKMYGKAADDLAFCDTKWDQGFSVTGIEVWASKWHVKAVQLSFSDGTKGPIHGDASNTEGGDWYGHGSISWKDGDIVTDAHIASNYWGNGDALGMLHLEVAGQKLDVKSDVGSFGGEPQVLSSGLLIGAYGSSGSYVNSFGLVFLKQSIGKSEIVEIKWPETLDDLNKKQEGVEQITVKSADYKNSGSIGSGDQTYKFENTEAQSTTISTTLSYSNTFGVSIATEIGGKVEVPLFAEATAKVTTTASYQYQTISTTETSKTQSTSLLFGQDGTIAPQKGARCTSTAQQGHYSTNFTAVIKITLNGGQTFTVEQPGHFDSVGFSKAIVDCKVVDIKELESGAVEVGPSSKKRAIGFKA